MGFLFGPSPAAASPTLQSLFGPQKFYIAWPSYTNGTWFNSAGGALSTPALNTLLAPVPTAATVFGSLGWGGSNTAAAINSNIDANKNASAGGAIVRGIANNAPGYLGFSQQWLVAWPSANSRGDQTFYVGINGTPGALAAQDNVSAYANGFAFSKDRTDTDIFFSYNNGGAPTKIDTGFGYTANANNAFLFAVYSSTNGGPIFGAVTNLETKVTKLFTVLQTDAAIPALGTLMYQHSGVGTGSVTATLVSLYWSQVTTIVPATAW